MPEFPAIQALDKVMTHPEWMLSTRDAKIEASTGARRYSCR